MQQAQLIPVHHRYQVLLQLKVVLVFLLIAVFCLGLFIWSPAVIHWLPKSVPYIFAVAWFVIGVSLIVFWAPRRYRVTGYSVQDDYLKFVVGALWYLNVVVTFNRLQHIEIVQSPLERFLGLSRLILYTAGSQSADLVLPGLQTAEATAVRDKILQEVRREELSDAAITVAGVSQDADS